MRFLLGTGNDNRLPHLIVGSLSALFVVSFSREKGGRPMRVSCLITFGCSLVAATAPPAQAVVSGNGDRAKYFQGTAIRKQAADGVFALIQDSHIDHSDPTGIRFVGSSVDSTESNRVPSRTRDVGSRGDLTFERRLGV
jgi:hypothetical protein